MQRPRFHLACTVLLAVLATSVNMAIAGEYTYAMAASETDDVTAAADVEPTTGVGANNRVEGMGARYFVSRDDAPAAAESRFDEVDAPTTVAPPTVPSGSSGPVSDKRAAHRWQSLVPGAIK